MTPLIFGQSYRRLRLSASEPVWLNQNKETSQYIQSQEEKKKLRLRHALATSALPGSNYELRLVLIVISDVWFLNQKSFVIAIGGFLKIEGEGVKFLLTFRVS